MQQQEPFFIVGAQRSGTTMLRLMLNSHPHLAVPFESDFIPKFYRKLDIYGDLSDPANRGRLLADIGENSFVKRGELLRDPVAVLSRPVRSYADLVRAIFDVYAESESKPRWGEKTPDYGSRMDVLWRLFPGCRIIHIVRDGRDVALSNRGISWGLRSMPEMARAWSWETLVTRRLGNMIGSHYMELHYEDLVRDPANQLRRICAHIGEEYDEAMLAYHEQADRNIPAESLQWHRSSVSAPTTAKIELWRRKLSVPDRYIFEKYAGDALTEFGYETEDHPRTLGCRLKELRYNVLGC